MRALSFLFNTADRQNRLQRHQKSKNNLRTFQAENREILKNNQLQTIFTGPYKKECICFSLVRKCITLELSKCTQCKSRFLLIHHRDTVYPGSLVVIDIERCQYRFALIEASNSFTFKFILNIETHFSKLHV